MKSCTIYSVNCFTSTIGKSLEVRFPEMEFVVHNMSFLCPENRKHSRCDICRSSCEKYCDGIMNVSRSTAKLQYNVYRNDDSLDFLFLNCDKQPDTFFCKLLQMSEHDQFGLLAVIPLCMSPDTVECERGFSTMNLTKDKFSTRLSQENLQARPSVCLDSRTLDIYISLVIY